MRGAAGDRRFKISRHAHAEPGKAVTAGNRGQHPEVPFRRFVDRRNAHQPQGFQPMAVAAVRDERVRLRRIDAGLLCFIAGVDLNEELRRPALLLKLARQHLCQRRPVERVDAVKQLYGVRCLVGLQGAYQMKLYVAKALAQRRPFGLCLLHPVFSEMPLACFQYRNNRGGIKRLAHRDKCHIFCAPAGLQCCRGNAANDIGMGCNGGGRHGRLMGKLAADCKDWYWIAEWPSLPPSAASNLRGRRTKMQSIVRQLAILVMLLAVAGCGYRPLYATDATGTSVATDLSMIAIQETGTRIGQQIRNRLISSMRPSGQEGEDAYRLVLSPNLTELVQGDQGLSLRCPTAADPKKLCGGIKRARLTLNVSYQLYDQQSGRVVNSGRSFSNIGYDVLYEPIADRQAKANATERAVLEVSNDIRTRLAAFMASRRS